LNRWNLACVGCPTCCKFVLELVDGKNAGHIAYARPISVMLMAGELNLEDWDQALMFSDFVNRTGIDRHTAVYLIDWAIELYKRGIITRRDTDGLVLRNDYDTIMKLLQKMINREGFGAILASGWEAAMNRIGKSSYKYAVQIKGITPALDPRHLQLGTECFSEAINPGAHNGPGASPTTNPASTIDDIKAWCDKISIPSEIKKRIFCASDSSINIGRFTKYAEDWRHFLDCIGLCGYAQIMTMYPRNKLAEAYFTLTGIEIDPEEFLKYGEKAHNLERAINAREGLGRKQDGIPAKWLQPLNTDGREIPPTEKYKTQRITKREVDRLMNDYYEEREWDLKTGNPSRDKLEELGLGFTLE